MTQLEPLERELRAWFVETAAPRIPDYVDDVLRDTARVRQRPRWSFADRWLPASLVVLVRGTLKPLPWRAMGLLVVLAALLAAALVVGSRPRVPAPFGRAGNGLVAYSYDGDIFTVDPGTGRRRAIAAGPSVDHDPRFSLDGTRVAFLRDTDVGIAVIVANADGSRQVVVTPAPFVEVDTDGISWSPDGRSIALAATLGGPPSIFVVASAGGEVRRLDVPYQYLEVYWRPPDGRQLMFLGGTPSRLGLFLASTADGGIEEVSLPEGDRTDLRLLGWTPDGQRFAYQRGVGVDEPRTRILDLRSGTESILEPGYGHLSNDGRRVVGLIDDREGLRLCVAPVDGGPCTRIGVPSHVPVGTTHESVLWSPDDEWIIVHPGQGGGPLLVDPDGGAPSQPPWMSDGAESWQRVAP